MERTTETRRKSQKTENLERRIFDYGCKKDENFEFLQSGTD
jgi:hypothetical protein